MSYPQDFDLSADAARNPQEPNTEGNDHAVREPFESLTKAVKNPVLLPLSHPWDGVQSGSGPATEAGHSHTTTTTDSSAILGSGSINDANKDGQIDLSRIQVLQAGAPSMGHTTGAADGRSVSSMGTSDDKTGESAYGTANAPFVDHELSHIAPWVQDKLSSLGKE